MVRSSDSILNVLLILLLVAFAVVSGAYYYGQLNPRVDQSTITNPVTSPFASNGKRAAFATMRSARHDIVLRNANC